MFYNARYYLPELRRFISADTIVPGAGNSQNLNRFSYVTNNPIRFIDPSGHALCVETECQGTNRIVVQVQGKSGNTGSSCSYCNSNPAVTSSSSPVDDDGGNDDFPEEGMGMPGDDPPILDGGGGTGGGGGGPTAEEVAEQQPSTDGGAPGDGGYIVDCGGHVGGGDGGGLTTDKSEHCLPSGTPPSMTGWRVDLTLPAIPIVNDFSLSWITVGDDTATFFTVGFEGASSFELTTGPLFGDNYTDVLDYAGVAIGGNLSLAHMGFGGEYERTAAVYLYDIIPTKRSLEDPSIVFDPRPTTTYVGVGKASVAPSTPSGFTFCIASCR